MEYLKYLKTGVRLLLGAFFITTAILKILSIDEFELYIYSFNIVNFVLSTVIARGVIALEFLLGALLILKFLYKYVWYLIMLTLVGFTLLLIYSAIFRNDANCHCMGALVQLNPIESIIKNIVSIILLFLIRRETEWRFRFKKAIIGVLIAIAVIVPFIIFPMDVVYSKFRSGGALVNETAFENYKQDSSFRSAFNIEDGNYLIAIVLPKCEYCKLSTLKIEQMVNFHQLNKERIKFVTIGDSTDLAIFQKETQAIGYQYIATKNVPLFLDLSFGSFPTYAYTQNGKIVKSVDLRGIAEGDLIEWLGK